MRKSTIWSATGWSAAADSDFRQRHARQSPKRQRRVKDIVWELMKHDTKREFQLLAQEHFFTDTHHELIAGAALIDGDFEHVGAADEHQRPAHRHIGVGPAK